jgi:tetratricopeptide (TPR) repeat protein
MIVRVVTALVVFVAACPVWANVIIDDALKSAARLEQAGEYFNSAEAYARVLRLEPGNQKAKKGLGRVADHAVSAKIAAARELEGALRFADAAAELTKAVDLRDRIRAAGIATGGAVDGAAALDGLIDRWVKNLYDEAVEAQDEELFSAAVANLRQIESLRPGHEDVRARLLEVWTAWGERDLREGRLRAAAERFEEASLVPGHSGVRESRRAATILSRLGSFALEKGACRSAVADLRAAALLELDVVDGNELRAAESCAVTCVTITAVAEPEIGLDASQVDRMKADIRGQLANGGSEFLRVLDRGGAGRGACDDAVADGAAAGAARRFRVAVAAKSQAMIRSPATSVSREFRTNHVVEEETVAKTVVVIRVYEEVFAGTMTGSITITDQRTGRSSPAIPVVVRSEATAQWVKSPTSSIAMEQVRPGQGPGNPPADPRLQRLSRIEDQRRDARTRLGAALTQQFAEEVARVVVAAVDAEISVTDPSEIDLPSTEP